MDSCYVAQSNLRFLTLFLPQHLESWEYSCEPACLAPTWFSHWNLLVFELALEWVLNCLVIQCNCLSWQVCQLSSLSDEPCIWENNCWYLTENVAIKQFLQSVSYLIYHSKPYIVMGVIIWNGLCISCFIISITNIKPLLCTRNYLYILLLCLLLSLPSFSHLPASVSSFLSPIHWLLCRTWVWSAFSL